jgi:hypothetical protein
MKGPMKERIIKAVHPVAEGVFDDVRRRQL